jgi:hypothetical protein
LSRTIADALGMNLIMQIKLEPELNRKSTVQASVATMLNGEQMPVNKKSKN